MLGKMKRVRLNLRTAVLLLLIVGVPAGAWAGFSAQGFSAQGFSAQGFSAQGSGAAVVLAASHLGYPLSTTHVMSGGVMGAGAATRLSAVRWGVARNVIWAWILTIPCTGAIAAMIYLPIAWL